MNLEEATINALTYNQEYSYFLILQGLNNNSDYLPDVEKTIQECDDLVDLSNRIKSQKDKWVKEGLSKTSFFKDPLWFAQLLWYTYGDEDEWQNLKQYAKSDKVEEGKFKEQDIENQENADILEQEDMPNKKKKLPRKELALSAGKKFKTPKGNELRISVLTLDVHTDSNEFSLYISCYIGDKNFQCHTIEEFNEVYLNN